MLKNKLLIPGLISGLLLISFGITFKFPNFLQHRTFSWLFYSLGIELILISCLLALEEIVVFYHKRNYKFLYYFSYYSLSLYLLHYLLFFLFPNGLEYFLVLIYSITILLLLGIFLRFIYIKLGSHFSLKFQIGRLSRALAKRI